MHGIKESIFFYLTKYIMDSKNFIFPYNKKMAYISSWDDVCNIKSFYKILDLSKESNLNIHFNVIYRSLCYV